MTVLRRILAHDRRHRNTLLVALCSLTIASGTTLIGQEPGHAYLLSRAPFTVVKDTEIEPVQDRHPSPSLNPTPSPTSHTTFPFSAVPNWGAMRSAAEWDRTYAEIPQEEWLPLPTYDRTVLITPLESLLKPLTQENIRKITTKLTYSTRFFGKYHLDSDEFAGSHAGIDIKMPAGTPVSAVADGVVHLVSRDPVLGIHVILKHRIDEETYYSVYGHLQATALQSGTIVQRGETIGTVGMTGSTSAPHLHLQIDRDQGVEPHIPYRPRMAVSRAEALRFTVHPIGFIEEHLAH